MIKEGYVEKNIECKSLDYIQDINEEHLLVVAGTDGYKSNVRLINSADKVLKSFSPEEGKFT